MATTGLRVVSSRGFATSKEGITKLPNGLSVLSVPDSRGPGLLRLAVASGSRFEKYENLGASHALRAGAGLTSGGNTYFGLTRGLQQSGAALDVEQGREIMSYTLTASRKEVSGLVDMFLDSVSNPSFKHWEILDACPLRIKNDLGNQTPPSMALELLYKAAFRQGLGNSIYSPTFMIGAHSSAMLKDFFSKTFAPDRALLIGMGGLSTETLLAAAERITFPSDSSPLKSVPSTFYSQETRSEHNGTHAHIALGFPGPSQGGSPKEILSAVLYQRILGIGSRVKRGSGLGRLNQIISSEDVSASAILGVHGDAGLFGAYVTCFDHRAAGETIRKVLQILRNPKITEAEVKAAKRNVLADLSEVYLSPSGYCSMIEEQVLLGGTALTDFKAAQECLNSITIGDVQAFAKKVSGGSMSMGSIGNLEHLPYMDEL